MGDGPGSSAMDWSFRAVAAWTVWTAMPRGCHSLPARIAPPQSPPSSILRAPWPSSPPAVRVLRFLERRSRGKRYRVATAAYGQGRWCETVLRHAARHQAEAPECRSYTPTRKAWGAAPLRPRCPPWAHGASPLREVPRGGTRWSPERRGSSRPRGPPGEMTARDAGAQSGSRLGWTWFPPDAEGEGVCGGNGSRRLPETGLARARRERVTVRRRRGSAGSIRDRGARYWPRAEQGRGRR